MSRPATPWAYSFDRLQQVTLEWLIDVQSVGLIDQPCNLSQPLQRGDTVILRDGTTDTVKNGAIAHWIQLDSHTPGYLHHLNGWARMTSVAAVPQRLADIIRASGTACPDDPDVIAYYIALRGLDIMRVL